MTCIKTSVKTDKVNNLGFRPVSILEAWGQMSMSSASESKGPRFKPNYRLKINQIRNVVGYIDRVPYFH